MGLTLEIEECYDCPRLSKRKVTSWQMGPNGYGYEYTCTKTNPPRLIYPHDGVNPPPKWCPLRTEEKPDDDRK